MCFLCRCYVLSLIYAAIRVQVLAYSEPTESGFQPTQTCSHAVIQNPNCTLLDVDDTVGQSNVDWLTGGLENGCDSRFHREWQRHEEKTIKDKKKNAVRKVQTVATADIYHCY